MKIVPLAITAVFVLGFNLLAVKIYSPGEESLKRIILSGLLAIFVYELTNWIYKRYRKDKQH